MHTEPMEERRLADMAARNHIPLSGTFELLPLCNMDCRMCYLRLSGEETRKLGGLIRPDQWLSLAQDMRKAGTLYLLLTGGEPLLYPGFPELYTQLREMGFVITVNTNATLVDEQTSAVFAKNRPRRVNVTLYGTDNETYQAICKNPHGYDQTLHGIRLLLEKDIPVKLNVTLVPQNVHQLDRFHQTARELGVPVEVNHYVVPSTRERNMPFPQDTRLDPETAAEAYIRTLETELGGKFPAYAAHRLYQLQADARCEEKKKHPVTMTCRAGRSTAWISWQGDLIPCSFMNQPKINVFDLGFQKAWDTFLPMIREVKLPDACAHCDLRCLCTVCGAFPQCDMGSTDTRPDYLCAYTQHIVKRLQEKVVQYETESGLYSADDRG